MNYYELLQHIRKILGDPNGVIYTDDEIANAINQSAPYIPGLPGVDRFWGKSVTLQPHTSPPTQTIGGVTWKLFDLPENYYTMIDIVGMTAEDEVYKVVLTSMTKAHYLGKTGKPVAFHKDKYIYKAPANDDSLTLIYIGLPEPYERGTNDYYQIPLALPYVYYWGRVASMLLETRVREVSSEEFTATLGRCITLLQKVFTGVRV